MSAGPCTVLDPADPAFAADPFPVYGQLRQAGPVVEVGLPNGRTAWVVTSYEHARALLCDRRLRAEPPQRDCGSARANLEDHMLNADGPRHARLRRSISAAFTPEAVAALRPLVESLADELLDAVADSQHPVDLVEALAFPLPVLVMCEVLGIPPADRDQLRRWTYAVSAPKAATSPTTVSAAWAGLHDYFARLMGTVRQAPASGLFSHLASDDAGAGGLTDRELLSMAFLLLFAGYETTMNLIAGGALTVLSHPEQRAALLEGRLDWARSLEELLRLVSPLEGATWRHAAEDVPIGGVTIRTGDSVLVNLAAANHDPDVHPAPESFEPGRTGRHLAFGHGPHVCVGARLARLEAQVALSRLFSRFPHLRLAAAADRIPWRPGLLVRGPTSLPVRLDDPLRHLRQAAAARQAAGVGRRITPRAASDDVLDLAGNDYLGLARDPRVTSAAAAAAGIWGAGSTGSRLVTGATQLHCDLEAGLAAHLGGEAALLFSSGYLANLGAISALASQETLVVSDAQNHASLVDACRLSRAQVVVAAHGDVGQVEALLAARTLPRAIVVTDAVFSVDGDGAPLAELAATARRHGALLVVDEAHTLGVVGAGGRGGGWAAKLSGAPDVVLTVTLSKSLGSQGGAVVGARAVVDHLVDTCRPFIFDTALAPTAVGAALAALETLRGEPTLPERVRANARELAGIAGAAGLVASQPAAAVLSIRIGDPHLAVAAARACLEHGVRVGCFRPPSVPDAASRLRLTARADLTEDDLARVTGALAAVAEMLPTSTPSPGTMP